MGVKALKHTALCVKIHVYIKKYRLAMKIMTIETCFKFKKKILLGYSGKFCSLYFPMRSLDDQKPLLHALNQYEDYTERTQSLGCI